MAAFTRTSNETVTAADGLRAGQGLSSTTTVGAGVSDETTTPDLGGATRWTPPDAGEGVKIFTNDAGTSDVASTPDHGGEPFWWDTGAVAEAVYANLRTGPFETRVRDKNGDWTVDLTAPTDHAPHAIQRAPDGTLFLWMIDFFSADELWEKPVGGSWTLAPFGTHPFAGTDGNMSVVDEDEVWWGSGNHATRWRRSTGWTSYFMEVEVGTVDFANVLVWAFSATNVIAVGVDGGTLRVAQFDGASWSLVSSHGGPPSGWYPTAIWADGNDMWVGTGRQVVPTSNVNLYYHAAQGVGSTWTNIRGSGFPTGTGFEIAAVSGIWGSNGNMWVSFENDQDQNDVVFSNDNGTTWTGYKRNGSGLGCSSIYGDVVGNVFTGHINSSTVSVWDMDTLSWTDEDLGGGGFTGFLLGSGGAQGHQRLLTSDEVRGIGEGIKLFTNDAGLPDEVEQTFGTAQYISESATTDSESHAHFIGRRPYLLFRGQTTNEAWDNPTTTGFTGYARDGTRYTAGVQDAGPVFAPWYSESAGTDRSSVGAFPTDYLLCATRSEIIIFDFANYPTDLDVWMRFRLGDSGTFKLISRIDETITDIKMANGVLVIVSKYNGIDNGGLFLIDFRQDDRRFLNLIRNDDHWIGTSGRDITDRDLGGNFDPAGVSPELRLRPINPESVSVYAPSDGDTYWVAVNGEDIGPDVYEVDSSGIPQMRSVPLGGNKGADDLTPSRYAVFDFDGWLWHSVGSIIYRNGIDYQEGSIRMPSQYDPRYRYVDLGVDVTGLISSLNYVYAATAVGVYRIDRGTLERRLMWTISGGGGLGLAGTPAAGEILVGTNPVIERLTEWTLAGAGFVGVATRLRAGHSGGVTLIRTIDDLVIDSKVYSDLAEDGSYVIQPVGL